MVSKTPDQYDRRQSQHRVSVPPRPRPQATWTPYAGVLLSLVTVLAVHQVSPQLQGQAPMLGITLPIMIGAIYGGFRPALLATFLCLWAGLYSVGVRWGGAIDHLQQLQIVTFLIVGLTISWFGAKHRSTQLKLVALAHATEKRKDDFLAMLGHELRNPLSGISSAARLLRHPALDQRGVTDNAEIIRRQVSHMEHLINDLLDVSRVTRGQVDIEKKPVDVVEVIHAAVEQLSALVEHRGHRLDLKLPAAPVWVLGDNTRLVQVVTNLLVNAARYTPPQGVLTLTLSASQSQAHLRVQDNGIGITAELAPHVFDLFMQAKRSTDGVMGGLGLGLTLVKSIVEAHGGEVSVYSAGVGHGSTFSVSLPLLAQSQDRPAPAVPLAPPEPARATQLLDILVVDDNRDAAQPLAMLLAFEGHRVTLAYSAEEALQQAEQKRFDVAILDIGLPDMDGYSLARQLKAMPLQSAARLVAVTGYGTEQDKARAYNAGFDQHIVKPMDCDLLLEELQQMAQRRPPISRPAASVCNS